MHKMHKMPRMYNSERRRFGSGWWLLPSLFVSLFIWVTLIRAMLIVLDVWWS